MSKAAVIVVAEAGPPASPCKEYAGRADTMRGTFGSLTFERTATRGRS